MVATKLIDFTCVIVSMLAGDDDDDDFFVHEFKLRDEVLQHQFLYSIMD